MNDELPPTVFPGVDPNDSIEEGDVVLRWIREERKRCDPIDKRIDELNKEFYEMARETSRIASKLKGDNSFLERLMIKANLSRMNEKLAMNRDLRLTLAKKRMGQE